MTRRFSVGLTVGGNAPQPAPTPLRDDFAAAQFFAMSDDEKLARPSFERMEAGLQFEAGGLTHSNSVATTNFEYETSIVDVPLRTVKRLPTRYRMEDGKLLALAGSGAAAFAPVRATGSERFAGPALGIAVSDQLLLAREPRRPQPASTAPPG